MTVLNLLAPIFLVIALGAALQRGGLMTEALVAGINRLLYWVGLPAVVFHTLVRANASGDGVGVLLLAMAGATTLNAGLSWLSAPWIGIQPRQRGTYVQASFRGNLTFVALPLLLTVPGVPLGRTILAFAPMLVLHNALTVSLLAISQSRDNGKMGIMATGREILKNPIILSALAGGVFSLAGWGVPEAIGTTLQSLGRMSLPLALLCIGASLVSVPVRGNRRHAGLAALHKVVLSPIIGYALGRWLGLDDATMLALLICLACPTASISYTMAKQMGGDGILAATAVVYSALASAVSLGVIIAVFAL